jgi:4-amino-4-deoxy-L-arabinose transferase-like glycosyltransferase
VRSYTGASMPAVSSPRVRAAAVLRRPIARVRAAPAALVVLLVLAAVHGTAWAVITAPWNGPDEVQHFAYAEHLARTGHAPQRNVGDGSQSTAQNYALYQLNLLPIRLQPGARPTWGRLDRTKRELATLPASAYKNGSGPNSAANYPPLYYAYEAVAYDVSPFRSELGRLFFMRLATVLLLVIIVGLTWAIASELLAKRWAVGVATALVALQPKLAFGAGIVNPDVMLALWATGALLAAIRLVQRGPTTGRIVALAACSGAAVLTHPRGYFVPPFAVIALLIAAWRFVPRRRWLLGAGALAVGGMVVALGAAVLWTRAHTGHGGSGTANPVNGFNVRQFVSYLWQFYLPKLSFMDPKVGPSFYGFRQVYIESFFGNFASLSVNYRPSFYDVFQLMAGVGLIALYTTVVVRWRTVVAQWPIPVLAIVFFGGLMALLHIVSYTTLRGANDPVLTGRYLLPAVALYGVAIAWVCSSLPRRIGLPIAGLLVGIAALMAVGGVGLSMERFYV